MTDLPALPIEPERPRPHRVRGFVLLSLTTLVVCASLSATLVTTYRNRRVQMQTDPNVATIWLMGVTRGTQHTLPLGNGLQSWLRACGGGVSGTPQTLTGRYTGVPGSLELWFDYRSLLPKNALLECHRVGETAFVDDLGQAYSGLLDFQGKYVGVYLPGYDHAARRLLCSVRWMPRQPAEPKPVSAPMTFTVELPPVRRVLPKAETLPNRAVCATRQGITVVASGARLSVPDFFAAGAGQQELTFRLKVIGGERTGRLQITDPYDSPLLAEDAKLQPLMRIDGCAPVANEQGIVWRVPVNGVGRSTDVIRLHLEVRSKQDRTKAPIPFDLIVPIQRGDEV